MNKALLIIFCRLINLIRGSIYPFIRLFLIPIIPALKKRLSFEINNLNDPRSYSFNEFGQRADIAFEVSSEGELEQVRPIIDYLLLEKMRVELIFASPSVEKKCLLLADKYPELLKIYRLPILSYGFFGFFQAQRLSKWITAPKLILCRYDFYPELLSLANSKSLILVSASLKGKDVQLKVGTLEYFFVSTLYNLFDIIITASKTDSKRFMSLGISSDKLSSYDFRVIQILKRLKGFTEVLNSSTALKNLEKIVRDIPKHKRVILGSIWPLEMEMFRNQDLVDSIRAKNSLFVLAPHNLGKDSIDELKASLISMAPGLSLYELEKEDSISQFQNQPGVLLIKSPGILCEAYSMFGHAFVGGGHGRSIHSVLEPYMSNCRVYCGPKTYRSTEFDFLYNYSPQFVHVVEELDKFYSTLSQFLENDLNDETRVELLKEIPIHFERMVKDKVINA